MTQHEAGKGSAQRPGYGYQNNYDRIDWPSRRKSVAHVAEADPDRPGQPKCGDCGGTLVVEGRPCPACAPTDDGPDGGNE